MTVGRPQPTRDERAEPVPDDTIPAEQPNDLSPPIAVSADVADLEPEPVTRRRIQEGADLTAQRPHWPQSPRPRWNGLWIGASVIVVLAVIGLVVVAA